MPVLGQKQCNGRVLPPWARCPAHVHDCLVLGCCSGALHANVTLLHSLPSLLRLKLFWEVISFLFLFCLGGFFHPHHHPRVHLHFAPFAPLSCLCSVSAPTTCPPSRALFSVRCPGCAAFLGFVLGFGLARASERAPSQFPRPSSSRILSDGKLRTLGIIFSLSRHSRRGSREVKPRQ